MKAESNKGVICTYDPRAKAAVLSVVCLQMFGTGGDVLWLLSNGKRVDTLMGLLREPPTLARCADGFWPVIGAAIVGCPPLPGRTC
ncbi:hypothetical protein ABA45_14025 [Marinobacter psychrophilus]|jgi:hypothetical protein|uniref:Uncharacterized protein n=1 Tax=Marinobacter psychrophilus TaxID=330734 RepID=A0A0H4I6K4_9GAMM|nr:hypothetical protein ABA45_14025 [Marinobacter psychrophilus]